MEYKNTLNLPKTDFPMKADLLKREPQRLERWYREDLYGKIQSRRAGAPSFVLHDGPPFANGDVHIGTALNKILKDFIIRRETIAGKYAPYIPGWDCHGLPIEFKVVQEMRKKAKSGGSEDGLDPASIRTACEEYALKYVGIQKGQFKRLGVLGDWDQPYLTLNRAYEAAELRLFADIVEKGFVYRGKKPVYWSIPCRTALAEAEVEYQDHVSQSVYVAFPLTSDPEAHVVIWTTTPWTLPANLAIAYNSRLEYVEYLVDGKKYWIASALASDVESKCGWTPEQRVRSFSGSVLENIVALHPFINRESPLFAGDHFVEDSAGTGFVHVAPGHGTDDYHLGLEKGLPTYSPVDDAGRLTWTSDLPEDQQMPRELLGKSILQKKGSSEANEAVLEILKNSGRLLAQEDYRHSYPHCWRSKTPVVFRGMDQWFVRIDHEGFRDNAMKAIDSVEWVPQWGRNRIDAAVQGRPDWCISRQRSWGVPIPAFYDAEGEPILDARVIRKIADEVENHGSNVWFEKDAEELWKLARPEDWTGSEAVAKSQDTLDVWIDSGSSSRAVVMRREEYQTSDRQGGNGWVADLYLEGSDQHRGWFQSSLLLSLAGNGRAPYKSVLTHGFMVDEDRSKISKSKEGGYVKPQTAEAYVGQYGADIVRLWVASQDFRNDIVVSEKRIKTVSETYRGIRNTLRYQLSNLFDFNPETDSLQPEEWTPLDRWIWEKFTAVEQSVEKAYAAHEFHTVYQVLSQFVAVELSAVYHDLVKDRLYALKPDHPVRRASQSVLYRMCKGLCQMLSPILVFTAEEAWEFLPGVDQGDSVHANVWSPESWERTSEEKELWDQAFRIREAVLGELEKARREKVIGRPAEARISFKLSGKGADSWMDDTRSVREFLNGAELDITLVGDNSSDPLNFTDLAINKANGEKCPRCWRWEADIGSNDQHPTICGRCAEQLV